MGITSFFSKIFRSKSRRRTGAQESAPDITIAVENKIKEGRIRLNRFLLTSRSDSGLVKKTKEWSLSKTNDGLFRLDGSNYSLLINTAPFLLKKDQKLTGLIRMSEAKLNRLLHQESDLVGFLESGEPFAEKYLPLVDEILASHKSAWRSDPPLAEIIEWNDFDIQRVLSGCSINTVALVLVAGGDDVSSRIRRVVSKRYMQSLLIELDSILSPGIDPELNPHSKNRPLQQFDGAIAELRNKMGRYLADEKRKNELSGTLTQDRTK